MFEHFGLLDAILGIWRYKIQILIAALCCAVVGIAGSKVVENRNAEWEEERYIASRTYFLEFTDEKAVENTEEAKNAATLLNTILDADFCMQSVTENLEKKYSAKTLIERLELSVDEENLTYDVIPALVNHSILADKNTVNINVNVTDGELAKAIIDSYDEYIEEFVDNMGNVSLTDLGGVHHSYYETKNSSVGAKKVAIIGFAAGLAMSCIVVFFYVLFNPVVNRRSDFEEYGLRVLGKL